MEVSSEVGDSIWILLQAFGGMGCKITVEANTKAVLEDVGHNADLYIANQEDNTQN